MFGSSHIVGISQFELENLWFFAHGVPEGVGVIAVASALGRIPIRWDRAVTMSFVYCLLNFLMLHTGILYPQHTLISIIGIIAYFYQAERLSTLKSMLIVLGSFMLLAIAEAVLLYNVSLYLLQMSAVQALADPFTRMLISIPQIITMFFVTWIIRKRWPLAKSAAELKEDIA